MFSQSRRRENQKEEASQRVKERKGLDQRKGRGKEREKQRGEKKDTPIPDPLSAAAMLNAYYISHGPVEFLAFRGYSWEGGGGKKKKKKGKKGKK